MMLQALQADADSGSQYRTEPSSVQHVWEAPYLVPGLRSARVMTIRDEAERKYAGERASRLWADKQGGNR